MTLGERIVSIRKENCITQKELAEQLDISPTRLNYWEKDKRFPPIPMLNAISEALNVDADYLIGRIEKSPEPAYASPEDEDAFWLVDFLVGRGYIKSGEDLSDGDTVFLQHWLALLDAWFKK